MSDSVNQVSQANRGIFRFVWSILSAIIWALVIGLIINCYFWEHEGYQKLILDINKTYQTQVDGVSLRSRMVQSDYDAAATELKNTVSNVINMTALFLINNHLYLNSHSEISESVNFKKIESFFSHCMQVLVGTFKVTVAKFIGIFSSFFVFLFASIIGAMDGLLARYIRTCEGGRESTFLYHKVSDKVLQIPVAILFLYLTSPFLVNPEYVVIFISVVLFSFFRISTSNLKKYL